MKKAQAAMEFLMTYGWAILVVLAAIGALAYFGVLSPSNLLPSKCTLSPGFDFGDCKASTSGLQVTIFNGLGADTTATLLRVNSTGGSDVTCNAEWDAGAMTNGETSSSHTFCAATFGNATIGQRFDADVKVIYTKSGETLSHTVTGDIQIKVEE